MRVEISALILVVALTSGCAFQITGKGLQTSVGSAVVSTCGPEDVAPTEKCHEARGAPISAEGAKAIASVLNPIAWLIKILAPMAGGV